MKKKQFDKARRILAAEQQLHRIEQWKLADIERRMADLDTQQVELIGALNETNALHGLFIDATARRLSSIAEEAERVGRERDGQALKLKEHGTRVKMCERLALDRQLEFEREKEGKALLDVVDQFVGRKRTSLP
jgi:hypothetical protein